MKASKEGQFNLELPDGVPIEVFLSALKGLTREKEEPSDDEKNWHVELARLIHSMRTTFRIPDAFTNQVAIEEIKDRACVYERAISDLRRVLRSEAVVTTADFPGDMAAIDIAKGCVVGLDRRTRGKAK
jgi:hypothetical protein